MDLSAADPSLFSNSPDQPHGYSARETNKNAKPRIFKKNQEIEERKSAVREWARKRLVPAAEFNVHHIHQFKRRFHYDSGR